MTRREVRKEGPFEIVKKGAKLIKLGAVKFIILFRIRKVFQFLRPLQQSFLSNCSIHCMKSALSPSLSLQVEKLNINSQSLPTHHQCVSHAALRFLGFSPVSYFLCSSPQSQIQYSYDDLVCERFSLVLHLEV